MEAWRELDRAYGLDREGQGSRDNQVSVTNPQRPTCDSQSSEVRHIVEIGVIYLVPCYHQGLSSDDEELDGMTIDHLITEGKACVSLETHGYHVTHTYARTT